jgi:flavin-dependent dehydrogenase
MIFARPRLYELMLRRIPPNRISHGKKVLRTEEKKGRVHIFCSDNTSYEADILVGADGAYSGVRQSLFKRLDAQGLLPKSDLEGFTIGSINMVAVADPKDPSRYPQLKDEFCHFSIAVGGNGARTVSLIRVERDVAKGGWWVVVVVTLCCLGSGSVWCAIPRCSYLYPSLPVQFMLLCLCHHCLCSGERSVFPTTRFVGH